MMAKENRQVSPFTGGEVIRKSEIQKIKYRGSELEVPYAWYVCVDTGEEYTDCIIDEENQERVFELYRQKEGIPSPADIKRIREKYGLPAVKMSLVLGFGINMYGKYESGEIPTPSNGKAIKRCDNPEVFKEYLLDCSQLEEKERAKALQKADALINGAEDENKKGFFLLLKKVQAAAKDYNELVIELNNRLEKFESITNRAEDKNEFADRHNSKWSIYHLPHAEPVEVTLGGRSFKKSSNKFFQKEKQAVNCILFPHNAEPGQISYSPCSEAQAKKKRGEEPKLCLV